ncbi:MAG: PilC/PilY family type IV pilus protein [Geobacteraceae bacterium]
MEGAANPTVTCLGKPSSTSYSCSSTGLGEYDNSREYYGYFDSGKCYTYSGSGDTGLFTPSGAATNHQCPAGTAWSGNMLNWSTTLAVDAFRKAFTGGNRTVDTTSSTVLLAAVNDGRYFPANPTISNAELYMPVSGTNKTRTIIRRGAGIGFGVCNEGYTSCTVGRTATSGEAQWPTAGTNTAAVYSLRIKACDSTGGAESRCNTTNNKPEGTIQKYMDKMRFALMSYAADSSEDRDGGVLRSVMKWVNPTIAQGMLYHDVSGNIVSCNTAGGCVNPAREVETTGIFRNNPDGATGANSGIINYINKFAYTSGYKDHDPMGEMYYEVVRYFKNLTPSVDKYCSGLTSFTAGYADGFAFHCNSSKTNTWGWRKPDLYSCSQNFVIAVNDANPWLDKRIPGSAFKANYGGSAAGGSDWCGSSSGPCDGDFLDGGTQVDVEGWTNKVGDIEGLTGKTLKVGCEVDASGACIGNVYYPGGKNVEISKLGRIIGTPPGPGKENSYNVAGLAYYAHMTDLRPDLAGMNNLTTYMIDTQEPNGSMLVGPFNMLYLAAKYGGFTDKDDDQSMSLGGKHYNTPYQNSTSCGGVTASPNTLCSEWDADNDGNPDNYFFASDSAKVENALNSAFSNILSSASSGTAAAVANNKSGERGANIIQALFYPQWPNDKNIKWLGEVQALWYYLDPVINYSTIREDTDGDFELDLTKDKVPSSDPFVTHALWKAGAALQLRPASDRQIYTLLDSSKPDLTDSANAFTTAKRAALKPLLNIASLTDTEADTLINYLRGVDSGSYRSRTVTRGTTTACWKLGDVINSTPQVQSAVPNNAFNQIYADSSYSTFINSDQYLSNNIVYTGANDGMMHAFKLGDVQRITDPTKPFRIAGIVDSTDLGKEEWAFIPKNALPYMKNQADQNYCHQYLVDGAPVLFDASIAKAGCSETNYWDCEKKTTLKGGVGEDKNEYLPDETSWKTVLIGSMGLGGASRDGNCNETLNHDANLTNNIDCVKTPVSNSGFSSYFALDVTAPLTPKLMWEISDANLPAADRGIGLTTPGVAIMRINAQSGTPAKPDRSKNGRWFAVFASGPTGTIDTATRQFLGRSDQNLKIYVVDIGSLTPSTALVKNTNYWVFDTGIKYAFANSMSGAALDLDRSSSALEGNYSDDVAYITYTRASLDSDNYPIDWNLGGVIRLVTNNSPDPSTWFTASLIDGIGPVTTSIGKLQDRNNKKLWIYFGEGRYFYKGDELNDTRRIFGVADPCYSFDSTHINTMSTTAANCPALAVNSSGVPTTLKDQTNTPNDALTTQDGWFITLDGASGTAGAERLVSDVTASLNGIVFYTTYVPDSNICTNGGVTSLWAVKYNSGGTPPSGGLKGKAPLQTSSGGIAMIDLESSFTQKGGRKLSAALSPSGMAPKGRFPPLLQPKAVKKILNIQER